MPSEESNNETRTYAIMAKPVGAACNLRCAYCYYLGRTENALMGDDVLERYISENLRIHGRDTVVEFAWHGGEPTLAGVDFYRRAVRLEKKYGAGRKMINTLQTNGTLIDDEWAKFFAENGFRLGVSIDGPKELHDHFRKTADGNGSFDGAANAVRLLRNHGVEYNILATVNAENSRRAEEVYLCLRDMADFIQFLPVAERKPEAGSKCMTAEPLCAAPDSERLADFSVKPADFGNFLCRVFDLWASRDVGKKYIQTIEAAIGAMTGEHAGVCVHEPTCGHAASVEADGSVYSCDRFAAARYRLGNVTATPLDELMEKNRDFGMNKAEGLCEECRNCRWLGLCWGGCPKDRFAAEGKNYLCEGYKRFFEHAASSVRFIKK